MGNETLIHHSHNLALVLVSIIVAIIASFVAIDLLKGARAAKDHKGHFWLIFLGGVAIGMGIWSAHFFGMLAFSIPKIEISYHLPKMILSVIAAILPCMASLWLMAKVSSKQKTYLFGAFFLTLGICGMHYIGIWSMELPLKILWIKSRVILSILLAIGFSYSAYYVTFNLKKDRYIYKIFGGIGLGCAVGSMHYMAMAAMSFQRIEDYSVPEGILIESYYLVPIIVFSTMLILISSLVGVAFNNAFRKQEMTKELLEEGIKQRDEFLSLSSHELKTPLTSLKLDLEMTQRKLYKKKMNIDEFSTFFRRQNISLNQMVNVVENMIEASKISSGDLELIYDEVDLAKIVEKVLVKVDYLAKAHRNILTLQIRDSAVMRIDPFRIEQVIINILSNAIYYAPDSEIIINLDRNEDEMILSVKDQGRGIPQKDMETIFQRYERARNVNDTRGLGLGLFIAYQVIQLHSGRIEVESELGNGTEMRVILPLS